MLFHILRISISALTVYKYTLNQLHTNCHINYKIQSVEGVFGNSTSGRLNVGNGLKRSIIWTVVWSLSPKQRIITESSVWGVEKKAAYLVD